MSKPPSTRKAAWKQSWFCACGNKAIKRLPNWEGVCKRCMDIESTQKTKAGRIRKRGAVQDTHSTRSKVLDVYIHPMPNFQ